jgi:hypothetical protein
MSITKEIVGEFVRGKLFETLQTDTEASDAVQVAETILCIEDDFKLYWQMFCEEHNMLNLLEDEDSQKAWKQDLKLVFEDQMTWLADCVGELRRAGNSLFYN